MFLQKNLVDVAILDMQMPEMSGIEACMAYAESNAQSRSPMFIMLSANVGNEDREQALKIGFAECLPKPLEAVQLIELLDKKAREIKALA